MWEDKNYFRWVNQLSPFHGELVGFCTVIPLIIKRARNQTLRFWNM